MDGDAKRLIEDMDRDEKINLKKKRVLIYKEKEKRKVRGVLRGNMLFFF